MFDIKIDKKQRIIFGLYAIKTIESFGLLVLGSYHICLGAPIDMRLNIASMALIASALLLRLACYKQTESRDPKLPARGLHSPLINNYVVPISEIISHSLMLSGAVTFLVVTIGAIGYFSTSSSLGAIFASLMTATSAAILLVYTAGNFIESTYKRINSIKSDKQEVDLPGSDPVNTSGSETDILLAHTEENFIPSDKQGSDLPALALGGTSSSETHGTKEVDLALS